jgi:hypothetical protein
MWRVRVRVRVRVLQVLPEQGLAQAQLAPSPPMR